MRRGCLRLTAGIALQTKDPIERFDGDLATFSDWLDDFLHVVDHVGLFCILVGWPKLMVMLKGEPRTLVERYKGRSGL